MMRETTVQDRSKVKGKKKKIEVRVRVKKKKKIEVRVDQRLWTGNTPPTSF